MDFIRGLFSSQPGLDRINPLGIVLMVVGAALALFVLFYPLASGAEVPRAWCDAAAWFDGWMWY